MRKPLALLLLVLALLVGALAAPATSSAATCVNLRASQHLKSQLRAAHHRVTNRAFAGPRAGSTYYGRCGSKYYALASFKDLKVGYGDQPEHFTRRPGHRWRDLGDTGGDVCPTTPRALLHLWGFKRC